MKNKLIDLNDHLFAQLERLSEENLELTALEREINRTKAITSVAREIIGAGKLALDAQVAFGNQEISAIPEILKLENGKP